MKSSFHSLVPFVPLFCNCHFRRLYSIQFLCYQAQVPAFWRLETRLSTSRLLFCTTLYCRTLHHNYFAWTTQKTVSVAKEACLLIRCIAMEVLLLRAFASARMCLASGCPAMVYTSQYMLLGWSSEWRRDSRLIISKILRLMGNIFVIYFFVTTFVWNKYIFDILVYIGIFNEFFLQIRAGMQVGTRVNCQYHLILIKFGILQDSFAILHSVTFHENPFSNSRISHIEIQCWRDGVMQVSSQQGSEYV
jgi:hypothetical protein